LKTASAGTSAGIVSFRALLDKAKRRSPAATFSGSFSDSSAARYAPFAVSRVKQSGVNQTEWEQAFVAARKAESLPSIVSASYSVRNRTSMTPSGSIVAFSK
jgi:hypothetical protein